MAQVHQLPTVPNATAGPISDAVLEKVIKVGTSAQDGHLLNDADASLILLTFPQIAHELLHRRRAMGVIADMTDMEGVTFLDDVRDNG